jgi:hypothetical protein
VFTFIAIKLFEIDAINFDNLILLIHSFLNLNQLSSYVIEFNFFQLEVEFFKWIIFFIIGYLERHLFIFEFMLYL